MGQPSVRFLGGVFSGANGDKVDLAGIVKWTGSGFDKPRDELETHGVSLSPPWGNDTIYNDDDEEEELKDLALKPTEPWTALIRAASWVWVACRGCPTVPPLPVCNRSARSTSNDTEFQTFLLRFVCLYRC